MVNIPLLKGGRSEDLETFLRDFKKTYVFGIISTHTQEQWVKLFLELFEGRVFDQLVMANVSLNPEIFHFGCMERILLGHIVSEDGIHINPTKIEKMIFFFPRQRNNYEHFWGQQDINEGSSRVMKPKHTT
jgi:hypothetical protein